MNVYMGGGMINIVIPMAGEGSRFKKAGFTKDKPFIDIKGKMMIERVIESLTLDQITQYTIIIQNIFKEKYEDELLRLCTMFNLDVVCVAGITQGASCTALAAFERVYNDEPVVFADSDNIFKKGIIDHFVKSSLATNIDGCLLTFNNDAQCYSYAKIDDVGNVVVTKEKEVISNHAIAGAYFFRTGKDFVKSTINMLIYGDKTKNEFYMSNVYNWMIKDGKKIGIYDITQGDWDCVGTPSQLEEFLRKN